VRVAQWADGTGVGAVVTSTGISVTGRSTVCHLSAQALASDGDETTIEVLAKFLRATSQICIMDLEATIRIRTGECEEAAIR
jgi:hypothetical protein